MTGISRSARQMRWNTLSRQSSSASPSPSRNSSATAETVNSHGGQDRVPRRVVGEERAIIVEPDEAARVGLEQAVVVEAVGEALRERPERDGEHVEDRRRAEHEQEELAAPGERKARAERMRPDFGPAALCHVIRMLQWPSGTHQLRQNSFAASACASSSAFLRLAVADQHRVHRRAENVLDLRILRDARTIVAVAVHEGLVEHRQERVFGEKVGVVRLADPEIAAGAAQVHLLVDRRAGDPLDERPRGFLLLLDRCRH